MADPFCALAAVGEPLWGSAAADTEAWVLWEHLGAWAPKPLASEGLTEAIRAHLAAWLEGQPRSRLQLIRRRDRPPTGPRRLYVGWSGPPRPWLVAFDLAAPEQLLDVDVGAVIAEGGHPAARPVEAPVHLVCTHGKRDQCCAKWGVPLYQALAAVDPDHVWQTTHTGGHRFAPNVLSFPHGYTYGRLAVSEAEGLVHAHRRGELHDVERLRGRTCYGVEVQAAEVFVRRSSGARGLDALRHVDTVAEGDDRWRVRFDVHGELHEVRVGREVTEASRPKSCGEPPVPVEQLVRL